MMDPLRAGAGLRAVAPLVVWMSLTLAPATAVAANGDCGQPASNTSEPLASDALFTLRAAVGSKSCDLCVCDVTEDEKISAVDALKILKKAVGQVVTLTCPACVPSLKGVVAVPPAAASSSAPVSAAALSGLVPAAGVTVDLVGLDADGTELPVLATTTSGADGSYKFTPLPAASSQTIVRATIGDAAMRAFVSGETVNVDPMSEVVVGSTIAAVEADASADLSTLTVAEIVDLVGLLREANVDLSTATSIADAGAILDDQTGGVYAEFAADFATGTGPTTPLAGNFNEVDVGMRFAQSFQPGSIGVSSVNTRSVEAHDVFGPLAVDAAGGISQASIAGRSHVLTETSGSTPQQQGPAVVSNASATLTGDDINDSLAAGSSTLFASDHGALMFSSNGNVSPGVLAKGSNIALIPRLNSAPGSGNATLKLALRQGQGLSNSSLAATYSALRVSVALEASTDAFDVHRAVQAGVIAGTITFDGKGNFGLGAFDGTSIQLSKDGPLPSQPAADPTVALSDSNDSKGPEGGATYTLSATGVLTFKMGSEVVGGGAVTPDRNVFVLRFSDDSAQSGRSGLLIGFKQGSGMNNASGHGPYRVLEFDADLEHNQQIGSPDASPDINFRSASIDAAVGTFDLDGAGLVTVHGSARRSVGLGESSGVQRHNSAASDVIDANVWIFDSSQTESQQNETHTYSVSSKGVVTIDAAQDGGIKGYLSADGNVFMLPNGDINATSMNSGFLIAVREP